jgi:hypothetical protein
VAAVDGVVHGDRALCPAGAGHALVALLVFARVEDVAGTADPDRGHARLHHEALAVGRGDEAGERPQRALHQVEDAPLVGVALVGIGLDHELRLRAKRQPRLVDHGDLRHAVGAGGDAVARIDRRALGGRGALPVRLGERHLAHDEAELPAGGPCGERRERGQRGRCEALDRAGGGFHGVSGQNMSQRIVEDTSCRSKS